MGAGPISHRELVARLHKFGYKGPRRKGKHPFMVKRTFKLTIPNDHRSLISGPLVDKILDQAMISLDDWNN